MRNAFIRSSIVLALCGAVLSGAMATSAITTVHAAHSGSCENERDTSGSCAVVTDDQTITFKPCSAQSCPGDNVNVRPSHKYAHGLYFTVSQGEGSYHARIQIHVTNNGQFSLNIVKKNGSVERTFNVVAKAPVGYNTLQVLTSHGYVIVSRNHITHPGLYRWVEVKPAHKQDHK